MDHITLDIHVHEHLPYLIFLLWHPPHPHIDIHVDKIVDNLMLHLNQRVVEYMMYHKIYIHKGMYKYT